MNVGSCYFFFFACFVKVFGSIRLNILSFSPRWITKESINEQHNCWTFEPKIVNHKWDHASFNPLLIQMFSSH